MIPIMKIGKILAGEYKDWLITIMPDENNCFVVPYWSQEYPLGFDDYYLSYADLEESIDDYHVEWTDEDYEDYRRRTHRAKPTSEQVREAFLKHVEKYRK